jgi:uncharacterized protein (DUF1499 family)
MAKKTRAFVLPALFLMAGCWGGPPDTLGVQEGYTGLAPCPSTPNCVHTGHRHPDGTRGMFILGRDAPGEVVTQIADVVASMPGAEVIEKDGLYVHAEFTSRIFRFVDDLEILIMPDREIVVRSASRVGGGDLGVNAARVEELRERLKAAQIIS